MLQHIAVGTTSGQVLLWALGPSQQLLDLQCESNLLRNKTSVSRVVWSPDGGVFGAALYHSALWKFG